MSETILILKMPARSRTDKAVSSDETVSVYVRQHCAVLASHAADCALPKHSYIWDAKPKFACCYVNSITWS